MGAKLFGIAALVIAVIALVPTRATDTSLDMYVHAPYIVVTRPRASLGSALGAFTRQFSDEQGVVVGVSADQSRPVR